MLFAAFVVGELGAAQCFDQCVLSNRSRVVGIWHRGFNGRLHRCQRHSCVASGRVRELGNQPIGNLRMKTSQSAFFVSQCAPHNLLHFVF